MSDLYALCIGKYCKKYMLYIVWICYNIYTVLSNVQWKIWELIFNNLSIYLRLTNNLSNYHYYF